MRQLTPGVAIKLSVVLDDGVAREKRLIVAHVSDRVVSLVINTEATDFQKRRRKLSVCLVDLKREDHDFIDRDCCIDCSRLRNFPIADVVRQLVERPEWILGRIDESLRDQVVAALKQSEFIAPAELESPLQALNSLPPLA